MDWTSPSKDRWDRKENKLGWVVKNAALLRVYMAGIATGASLAFIVWMI